MCADITGSSTSAASPARSNGSDHSIQKLIIAGILVVVLVIILVAAGTFFLLSHPDTTEIIRDIVIIWIALEALVIGIALIALAIQMARLTSLLRQEIKPILENTGDTIRTLRGTARFVSDNITDPVVKVSGAIAGVKRFIGLLTPGWQRKRKQK
jgi:amino acid permease